MIEALKDEEKLNTDIKTTIAAEDIENTEVIQEKKISKDKQFLIANGIISNPTSRSPDKTILTNELDYQHALNYWLTTKGLYDGIPQLAILEHYRKYRSSLSSRLDKKDENDYSGK